MCSESLDVEHFVLVKWVFQVHPDGIPGSVSLCGVHVKIGHFVSGSFPKCLLDFERQPKTAVVWCFNKKKTIAKMSDVGVS